MERLVAYYVRSIGPLALGSAGRRTQVEATKLLVHSIATHRGQFCGFMVCNFAGISSRLCIVCKLFGRTKSALKSSAGLTFHSTPSAARETTSSFSVPVPSNLAR